MKDETSLAILSALDGINASLKESTKIKREHADKKKAEENIEDLATKKQIDYIESLLPAKFKNEALAIHFLLLGMTKDQASRVIETLGAMKAQEARGK